MKYQNKNLLDKLIEAAIEISEAKKEISILQIEISDQNKIKEIVNERIKTRKPIQYLIGKAYFMDFELAVNERVLIPRPETEMLVEEAVKRCRDVQWPVSMAIDIGTGSGIIAIALCKMLPNIEVIAIDIDKDIINLANENAKKNNVGNRIHFKTCDLFSDEIEELFRKHKFDLVISNPPYIKEFVTACQSNGVSAIQPEIVHEPKIALYGSKENNTGLVYYERIFDLCRRDVARNVSTLVAFEIDPPIVNDLKMLLKKYNLNSFEIIEDYGKSDRCLFIYC